MTEEEIKQIIREELTFLINEKFVFNRPIQLLNGTNVQVGKGNGTIIGTEGGDTGQKLGFFNTTPVVQLSTISDPTGAGDAGVDTPARDKIGEIIDALQLIGLMQ